MVLCKKCNKEFVCLKDEEHTCPECLIKAEKELKQDRHLEIKQKRFTSE